MITHHLVLTSHYGNNLIKYVCQTPSPGCSIAPRDNAWTEDIAGSVRVCASNSLFCFNFVLQLFRLIQLMD